MANNFEADREVLDLFNKEVDKIRSFGYPISEIAAPLWNTNQGLSNITSDRKVIANEMFKDINALILPTIPTNTPLVQDTHEDPQALSASHTMFANYYGLPAITVHSGFDKQGLPLGLQIVGKPWDEYTILQFANRYQTATTYSRKHPIE